jgi:signal transduction histidine kinase
MALEQKIESMETGFKGHITLDWKTDQRINGEVALAFYDVAELALDNAAAHSGASRIKITISGKQRLTLEVRDNGRGFNTRKPRQKGLGILRMQAAARRIGATFLVESVAGRSTIVKLLYAPTSSAR